MVDGCIRIEEELESASAEVKSYLRTMFAGLLDDARFSDAVLGFTRDSDRADRLKGVLRAFAGS